VVLCWKGKVRGSKHRWFENGKCEIKKRPGKEEKEKEKYENDFRKSMAADGGERIRTFCFLDNRKILEGSISASLYIVCICVCMSHTLSLYSILEKKC